MKVSTDSNSLLPYGSALASDGGAASVGLWARHRNLRKKPAKPALGRGRVQRMVRRAFTALEATELTTSQLADWAYARRRPGSLACGLYRSLYRACERYCVRVRRVDGRGRPWLWRLL